MNSFFSHTNSIVESKNIGKGTKIWAFSHIMKDVVIGENCNIGENVYIESGVIIGNGVTIKNGVAIWEGVEIEDNVFIGPNVVFTNDLIPRSPRLECVKPRYQNKGWLKKTIIHEGASLCANSTILCGTKIGRYALVGAASLVTRNVQAYSLVYGVPAKFKKFVNEEGDFLIQEGSLLINPLNSMKYKISDEKLKEIL